MIKTLVVAAVLVSTLVITPYFMAEAGPGFSFGEREVRAAIEGQWTLQLTDRKHELKIELARKATRSERETGWIRSASACSHRSLVRSAEACLDSTEVELIIRVAGAAPNRGDLRIIGKSFERGHLSFELGGQEVAGMVSSAGKATEVRVGDKQATLVRRGG
jgi:hypothetical protein